MAESASRVSELVGEIAAASQEQSEGIEQVNKAVTEMDGIIQQNAANAEENASASKQMATQAEQMKGFVDELVQMVGGNTTKKTKTQRRQHTETREAQSRELLPVPDKKAPARTSPAFGPNEVRPDQVIPMEDDFKDF